MLTTNRGLEKLANFIGDQTPNWEMTVNRFKQTRSYLLGNYNFSNLRSHLSEAHVGVMLDNAVRELRANIDTNPKFPDTHKKFKFDTNSAKKYVLRKSKNGLKYFTEYDEFAIVDSLPTIFEIKIGKYVTYGNVVREKGNEELRTNLDTISAHMGARYAMDKGRISYITRPVRKYFHIDSCGYVLIIPKDQIRPRSMVQKEFRERGGILVPFYTDRKTYEKEVREVQESFGL